MHKTEEIPNRIDHTVGTYLSCRPENIEAASASPRSCSPVYETLAGSIRLGHLEQGTFVHITLNRSGQNVNIIHGKESSPIYQNKVSRF